MSHDIQEFTINNIGELIDEAIKSIRSFNNGMFWWRGHANKDWILHPSIYHKGHSEKEANITSHFMSRARVLHNNVPVKEDLQAWLFLMQHYGLPTRLLDWTESLLTALFFAVQENDGHDGVIWGVQPTILNKHVHDYETIMDPFSKYVQPVFEGSWSRCPSEDSNKNAIAIAAQQFDLRQMVQSSEFTVHGNDIGINNLPSAHEYLIKIIIPSSEKSNLALELRLLNINESQLFPDLEHLAKDLTGTNYCPRT